MKRSHLLFAVTVVLLTAVLNAAPIDPAVGKPAPAAAGDDLEKKLLETFHLRLQRRSIALVLCGVQDDLSKALVATGLHTRIGDRHIIRDRPKPDQLPDNMI